MGCKYGNRGKQVPYINDSLIPPHLVHFLILNSLQITLTPLKNVLMVGSNFSFFILKVLRHVNQILEIQTLALRHRLLTKTETDIMIFPHQQIQLL